MTEAQGDKRVNSLATTLGHSALVCVTFIMNASLSRSPSTFLLQLQGLHIPFNGAFKVSKRNDKPGLAIQYAQLEKVVLHK
jgi:hypothetical protein